MTGQTSDTQYWVAFNRIAGVGRARYRLLEKHFGRLENAWRATAAELPAAGAEWAVAVVGTRRPTPYGRQVAEHLASDLASQGITIVSGLARGIDAIAHRAALERGGRTGAVMACGLDIVYPPEHLKVAQEGGGAGAPAGDHPPGTAPRRDTSPPPH